MSFEDPTSKKSKNVIPYEKLRDRLKEKTPEQFNDLPDEAKDMGARLRKQLAVYERHLDAMHEDESIISDIVKWREVAKKLEVQGNALEEALRSKPEITADVWSIAQEIRQLLDTARFDILKEPREDPDSENVSPLQKEKQKKEDE